MGMVMLPPVRGKGRIREYAPAQSNKQSKFALCCDLVKTYTQKTTKQILWLTHLEEPGADGKGLHNWHVSRRQLSCRLLMRLQDSVRDERSLHCVASKPSPIEAFNRLSSRLDILELDVNLSLRVTLYLDEVN